MDKSEVFLCLLPRHFDAQGNCYFGLVDSKAVLKIPLENYTENAKELVNKTQMKVFQTYSINQSYVVLENTVYLIWLIDTNLSFSNFMKFESIDEISQNQDQISPEDQKIIDYVFRTK